MIVRLATPDDAGPWLRMRQAFWPDGAEAEHAAEIVAFFEGRAPEPLAVLIAQESDGGYLGFAELSIRPCAEGCRSTRVAYLEGWYVAPESRRRGVGRALVGAAEEWARGQGCSEFASDTGVANAESAAAHRAVGFSDVGVIRCFRKTVVADERLP